MPCAVELAFDKGRSEQGCSVTWSHALRSHRVEKPCDKCIAAATKQADLLAAVKNTLKSLRKTVDAKASKPAEDSSGSSSEAGDEAEDSKAKESNIESEIVGVKEARRVDEEGTTAPFEVKFDPDHRPLKLLQQLEPYKDKST